MNPFLQSPDERLNSWKSLREEIRELDETEALSRIVEYWAQAPLSKMAYDPEEHTHWPTPWEMVMAGDWCPYSVAIGMEFTLRLAGWETSRLEILLIRDYDISEQKMILKIDETKVLNYSVGIVQEYPTTKHDILATYRNDGKRYILLNL